MAYYSLGAYDANVLLSSFLGLQQAGDNVGVDIRYAVEAENVETPFGVLQPMAAPVILETGFESRIETLAKLHRRWYSGTGSKDWLFAAFNGKIKCKQSDSSGEWTELPGPEKLTLTVNGGFTAVADRDVYRTKVSNTSGTTVFTYTESWDNDPTEYGITITGDPVENDTITAVFVKADDSAYESDVWSWAAYEINPPGSAAPVDVLLMSNAKDGMIMVIPPFTATISHNDWMVYSIDTLGKKFGVIERFAERIWGGAIPEDPDMLMYSRPYDPTDWTQDNEDPANGAGDIQQPSWDGDSFTALRSFGSQLIAFKKNRVWRILGTDPGEYTFKEQYGGGTPYFNTIAVDVDRIWMAERDGLSVYDGASVNGYARESIEKLWLKVNKNAMDQMCSALFKERFYLSVPTGNSEVNNDLIVFNLRDRTILYYTDVFIESFLVTDDNLYATSSSLPGKIITLPYDSWETGTASGKNTKWVTPWIDFSRKSLAKGGYEIYFSPEVRGFPVTFRFSIQSEKKIKSKNITIQPTVTKAKQKRIRFGGTSRKFRMIIETLGLTQGATWRLTGGIQMVVETDPD